MNPGGLKMILEWISRWDQLYSQLWCCRCGPAMHGRYCRQCYQCVPSIYAVWILRCVRRLYHWNSLWDLYSIDAHWLDLVSLYLYRWFRKFFKPLRFLTISCLPPYWLLTAAFLSDFFCLLWLGKVPLANILISCHPISLQAVCTPRLVFFLF